MDHIKLFEGFKESDKTNESENKLVLMKAGEDAFNDFVAGKNLNADEVNVYSKEFIKGVGNAVESMYTDLAPNAGAAPDEIANENSLNEATDVECTNCGENFGKDKENPKLITCGNCGEEIRNPYGYANESVSENEQGPIEENGWVLVDQETNEPINKGDKLETSKGEEFVILGGSAPRSEASTGKVWDDPFGVAYYAGVVGTKWVKKSEVKK